MILGLFLMFRAREAYLAGACACGFWRLRLRLRVYVYAWHGARVLSSAFIFTKKKYKSTHKTTCRMRYSAVYTVYKGQRSALSTQYKAPRAPLTSTRRASRSVHHRSDLRTLSCTSDCCHLAHLLTTGSIYYFYTGRVLCAVSCRTTH